MKYVVVENYDLACHKNRPKLKQPNGVLELSMRGTSLVFPKIQNYFVIEFFSITYLVNEIYFVLTDKHHFEDAGGTKFFFRAFSDF